MTPNDPRPATPATATGAAARTLRLAWGLLALAGAAGFWFTPHADAIAMKRAADANDLAAFARHVDLDAVRDSLKAARRDRSRLGDAPAGSRAGRVAERTRRLLFGALTDRFVDRLVTHERLAAAIRGEPARPGREPLRISTAYEAFDRFAVTVRDPAAPAARPVVLVFSRHGLADWKLTAVRG